MLRELLTRYGHIDRVWFDLWGDNCGAFGSGCPRGALGHDLGDHAMPHAVRHAPCCSDMYHTQGPPGVF